MKGESRIREALYLLKEARRMDIREALRIAPIVGVLLWILDEEGTQPMEDLLVGCEKAIEGYKLEMAKSYSDECDAETKDNTPLYLEGEP